MEPQSSKRLRAKRALIQNLPNPFFLWVEGARAMSLLLQFTSLQLASYQQLFRKPSHLLIRAHSRSVQSDRLCFSSPKPVLLTLLPPTRNIQPLSGCGCLQRHGHRARWGYCFSNLDPSPHSAEFINFDYGLSLFWYKVRAWNIIINNFGNQTWRQAENAERFWQWNHVPF